MSEEERATQTVGRNYEVSSANGASSATSGCGHSPDSSESHDSSSVLSGVDSDWDEEDIQLLRILKDPNFDANFWASRAEESRYSLNRVYQAKVQLILKEVEDWKEIHDLLMEDFRKVCGSDELNKQYKEDFVKTKREMRSLKKVHRRALKKMAEKEESYLDVCKERDELQLKLSEYEEKLEAVSVELEKTHRDKQVECSQELQKLRDQLNLVEGEKAKLEHLEVEVETLRTDNFSVTNRNKDLQGECQHLTNQLYQISEKDRERLDSLDQVISANKEQISILQSERDDLEQKNLVLSSTSMFNGSVPFIFSTDGSHAERIRRPSTNRDSWSQHSE